MSLPTLAPGPALLNAHSKHSSSGNRGCSRSNLRLTQGCRHSNNTHLPHLLSATISLSSPGDFSSLGTHLPAPVLNPGAFSWLCKHFPSPNAKPRCDLRAQKNPPSLCHSTHRRQIPSTAGRSVFKDLSLGRKKQTRSYASAPKSKSEPPIQTKQERNSDGDLAKAPSSLTKCHISS